MIPPRGGDTDDASIRHFFAQSKAVPALIDLHTHLLPAIDDGPAELAGMLSMARVAVDAGTTAIAVTPHVNEAYPTTPRAMREALERAVEVLHDAGIPLELRPGAEIALDRVDQLSDADLRAFNLGGSAAYILLECPFSTWPMGLELYSGRMAQLGLRTILAHPERSIGVQNGEGLDRLSEAVERGLLVQVNSSSLTNISGKASAAAARELLANDLIHIVASDAHDPDHRPPRLDTVAKAIGDAALAQWLTTDAPAAVLRGESLPERPAGSGESRRGGLLARFRKKSRDGS